jgi:hypothetical protein
MTDLNSMRDRLLTRCPWDGGWLYGRQPCPCCGRVAPDTLEQPPRRPNIGRRSA